MLFTQAIKYVLKHEGGLVDHPKDPGGITKYGISLRAYPDLGEDGIRNLTRTDAKALYKRDYWDALHCDELPQALRLMVFDCGVNQGVGYAAKALQASVGAITDGVIGIKTIEAVYGTDISVAARRMACNRASRYMRNKNWDTFGEGWINRLLDTSLHTNV